MAGTGAPWLAGLVLGSGLPEVCHGSPVLRAFSCRVGDSLLCSSNFLTGAKSDDLLSPNFVPILFSHFESPIKRKAKRDLVRYERSREVKTRRIEWCSLREEAATALLQLRCDSVDVNIEETSDETSLPVKQ